MPDPETLQSYIDVLRYALDTLWPYLVALGIATPLVSRRIRQAAVARAEETLKPKPHPKQ